MMKTIFMAALLMGSIPALADTDPGLTTACKDINPIAAPVGTRCYTRTGQIFTRVVREGFGRAWEDLEGMIWSGDLGKRKDAIEFCKKLGASVPTAPQYLRGEERGFREVIDFMPHEVYSTRNGNSLEVTMPTQGDSAYQGFWIFNRKPSSFWSGGWTWNYSDPEVSDNLLGTICLDTSKVKW